MKYEPVMRDLIQYCLIIMAVVTFSCQPDIPDIPPDNTKDTLTGLVEFDFQVPHRNVPERGVHRIDLSIAKTAHDLYRGQFLITANTYDIKQLYTFRLLPGDYYYQAGIICTCLGDTCLWDGFPGGRLGTKWAVDRITIVKGEKLSKPIQFN